MKSQKQNSREIQSLTKQLQILQKQRASFQQESAKIYQQILKLDQKFTYTLYEPVDHQGIQPSFLKSLYLGQIDKLMQQKQILMKKLEMLKFIQNGQKNKREEESLGNHNHYAFLRNVWSKWGNGAVDSAQKIDSMNKIVNNIRNNIKHMISNENESILKQVQANTTSSTYISSQIESAARQEIQKLLMKNQQLQTLCYQFQYQISTKNMAIHNLQKQLHFAHKQTSQSIQALSLNNDKILLLEKCKAQLQKQLKNSQSQKQSFQVTGISQEQSFKIKIQAENIKQGQTFSTCKSLQQILNFFGLRSNSYSTRTQLLNPQLQLQIPKLKLGDNLSTNDITLTDRFISKYEKFIPIHTQRTTKRTARLKKINSESLGDEHENIDQGNAILKRFCRKFQRPLASDQANMNEIEKSEPMIN